MRSETIGKLAEALSKAQGMMKNADKDRDNPFFKSKYADLAGVWDACRKPLSDQGIAVSQLYDVIEGRVFLTTELMHSSGEFIQSIVPIQPVKPDPQSMVSAMTYMKRAALSAIAGVAAAEMDDDGETATGRGGEKSIAPKFTPKESFTQPPIPYAPSPVITSVATSKVTAAPSLIKPVIIAKGTVNKPMFNPILKEVMVLLKELNIETEAAREEFYRECGTDSLTTADDKQLEHFKKFLLAQKVAMAKGDLKPAFPVQDELSPWDPQEL